MAQKTIGKESAFPDANHANPQFNYPTYGLTKREYFAAMAMQGILANNEEGNTQWDYTVIGKHSLLAADALIEELNK